MTMNIGRTKHWTDKEIAEMEVTTPDAAVRTLLNTACIMQREGDNLTKLRGAYIEQAVKVLSEKGMPAPTAARGSDAADTILAAQAPAAVAHPADSSRRGRVRRDNSRSPYCI
jgi:hypothetical protein